MTPVSYKVKLSSTELNTMVNFACCRGHKRVNPTKRWSVAEKKEAARFAIERLVSELLYPEQKKYIQKEEVEVLTNG